VKNIALPGTSPPAAAAVRLERPENATRPERLPLGKRMAAALEFLTMGVDETVRGSEVGVAVRWARFDWMRQIKK